MEFGLNRNACVETTAGLNVDELCFGSKKVGMIMIPTHGTIFDWPVLTTTQHSVRSTSKKSGMNQTRVRKSVHVICSSIPRIYSKLIGLRFFLVECHLVCTNQTQRLDPCIYTIYVTNWHVADNKWSLRRKLDVYLFSSLLLSVYLYEMSSVARIGLYYIDRPTFFQRTRKCFLEG